MIVAIITGQNLKTKLLTIIKTDITWFKNQKNAS